MPGDVVEAALGVAVDALADIGSLSSESKRRRSGCWRLFLAVLAVVLVVGVVIAFRS